MPARAKACVESLSDSERASLMKLCNSCCGRDIPADHAKKLLDLGLAELTCGDLGPTGVARVAIRNLH